MDGDLAPTTPNEHGELESNLWFWDKHNNLKEML